MYLEFLTLPLTKAFTDDVRSREFSSSIVPTSVEPIGNGAGLLDFSTGSLVAPAYVFLVPYSSGGIGIPVSLRLWGWRKIGSVAAEVIWWPFPLVELACVTGQISGLVIGTGQPRIIADNEYACESIAVAQNADGAPLGGLGNGGEIGGFGLGSGTTAFAIANMRACQKVSLDPRQDNGLPVNAMWTTL